MRLASIFIIFALLLVFPATAMAQETTDSAQVPESQTQSSSSSPYKDQKGFSLFANVGGTIAFAEQILAHEDKFTTNAAGFQATVDIGYHWKALALYVEIMARSAFAYKDTKMSYCDLGCFKYKAHRKGEWDGFFGGVGLMLIGFIPVTDVFHISVGGGPIVYVGKTMSGDNGQGSFAFKLQLGFHFAISKNYMVGLTISEEGLLMIHRSISPAFSITYTP